MTQSGSFNWQGRAWLRSTKRASAHGVQLALEHTLGVANKLVPLDEGTLERSGKVTMDGTNAAGTISYDTVYAVRQHEELTWKHLPGRQAKYLEQPLNTERAVMLAIVAETIRREGFLGGRLG
ncbi:hypothetical protein [Streptacidiphilus sp. EB103A]|uniref:hypothetical protein n=1 Tax=Streptacidiphilus sp. EB103A TaxID=3156275 RepID=UPI0035112F69